MANSFKSFAILFIFVASSVHSTTAPTLKDVVSVTRDVEGSVAVVVTCMVGTIVMPAYVRPLSVLPTTARAVPDIVRCVVVSVPNVVGIVAQFMGDYIHMDSQLTSSGLFSSSFSQPGTLVAREPMEVSQRAEFALSAELYVVLGFNVTVPADIGVGAVVTTATVTVARSVPSLIYTALVVPPVPAVNTWDAVQDVVMMAV